MDIKASDLLELVPDVVIEDLLPHRPERGDGASDAGVQLAVRAYALHHVHVVALPGLLLHQPMPDPAVRVVEVLEGGRGVQRAA